MELKLDLHVHSVRSPDGRMPLEEIVARCRARGLHGAAVCDHDQVLGEAPSFPDFLLIPGVEVSTRQGHLLGLFVSRPVAAKELPEAIGEIHAQGGLAVLAHPFQHSAEAERFAAAAGLLDGVEVFNSRADRKNRQANAMAAAFARAHGLRPFAGSDAHVPQEVGNAFLTVEAPSASPEAVRQALLDAPVTVTGRRSPARFVAMSQLTKRKKTGASPAAWLKWALFALKCCAQDLFDKGE